MSPSREVRERIARGARLFLWPVHLWSHCRGRFHNLTL